MNINEILAQVDALRRRAGRNIKDWIENPKDALELAATRTAEGIPEQLSDPGNYIPGGGLAGTIRRGGASNLVGIHQSGVQKFAEMLNAYKKPINELYSPSFAINKDAITQNFGDKKGTLTFVMRPDVLDPVNRGGSIFARDAYTPRMSAYPGSSMNQLADALRNSRNRRAYSEDQILESVRNKLRYRHSDRYGETFPELRLVEDVEPDDAQRIIRGLRSGTPEDLRDLSQEFDVPIQQAMTIAQSRPFKSFKSFEDSPRGAGLLDSGYFRSAKAQELRDKYNAIDAVLANPETTMEQLRAARHESTMLPSEYAELKTSGPVGLHPGNIAGAILQPKEGLSMNAQWAIADALRRQGINLKTAEQVLNPHELFNLANEYTR